MEITHSIKNFIIKDIYPKLKCYTVCIQLNKDIIILEYRTTESLSKHDKIKDIYYTIYKILFYNSNKIKKKK